MESSQVAKPASSEIVHRWNHIAIDATGLDHTPPAPGETRVFGEQLGPGRSSRAMAIIHLAIFDAINGAFSLYDSFSGVPADFSGGYSIDAAVSKAAHDTLGALYPSQKATFDHALSEELLRLPANPRKSAGLRFGRQIAAATLATRVNDGAEVPEEHYNVEYIPTLAAGFWRQDPISLVPIALGAHWGNCRPFVLASTSQFRLPPPPALNGGRVCASV